MVQNVRLILQYYVSSQPSCSFFKRRIVSLHFLYTPGALRLLSCSGLFALLNQPLIIRQSKAGSESLRAGVTLETLRWDHAARLELSLVLNFTGWLSSIILNTVGYLLAMNKYSQMSWCCVQPDVCCRMFCSVVPLLSVVRRVFQPLCSPAERPQVRPAVQFGLKAASAFTLFSAQSCWATLPVVCCVCLL